MRTASEICGMQGGVRCLGRPHPNEVFTHRGQIIRALPHMLLDDIDECAGCIAKHNWMLCRELPGCSGMTFVLHGDQEGDRADLIQEDNEIGNFEADAFRKWFIVERVDQGASQAGRHVAAALASKFQS